MSHPQIRPSKEYHTKIDHYYNTGHCSIGFNVVSFWSVPYIFGMA